MPRRHRLAHAALRVAAKTPVPRSSAHVCLPSSLPRTRSRQARFSPLHFAAGVPAKLVFYSALPARGRCLYGVHRSSSSLLSGRRRFVLSHFFSISRNCPLRSRVLYVSFCCCCVTIALSHGCFAALRH